MAIMDLLYESRKSARRRILKQGMLIFQSPFRTTNVVVRNVGFGGVKFELSDPLNLPYKFDLVMVTAGTVTPVVLIWRRDNDVGVAYCGETKNVVADLD